MPGEFNRYSRFQTLLYTALDAKTSWGRNELKQMVSNVLLQVADEELGAAHRSEPRGGSTDVRDFPSFNPVPDEPNVPW